MSDFHFGVDDYDLNYYPKEASDGMGGVDWDKVERVEIEGDVYVKEHACEVERVNDWLGWHCKSCDTIWQGMSDQKPSYCMRCGRKVVSE